MKTKLTSRKFWICVAAFLASIAASVQGVQNGNETLAAIGFICSAVSAAIYAAAEAYVDGARLKGNDNPVITKEVQTDESGSGDGD